jgi:signal transduction histidine kinase
MQRRLTRQFNERVETLMAATLKELDDASHQIEEQLAELAQAADRDERLFGALVADNPADRPYLLDFAGQALRLLGLDMLELRDYRGTILSSGHYRNEYDSREPGVVDQLAAAGAPALVLARSPGGAFIALARTAPLALGDQTYQLVGGRRVDATWLRRLSPGGQLAATLVHDGGALSSDPDLARRLGTGGDRRLTAAGLAISGHLVRVEAVPLIRAGNRETALLVVSHPRAPLTSLLRRVDLWLAAALGLTVTGSLLLALWVTGRISRPLRDLAAKTARLDLDRLDTDFSSRRRDEVGHLARLLQELVVRLRASLAGAQDAERRATLGEVARQVNHDIRNGLTPLRNVLRHLTEVAQSDPGTLPGVFAKRQPTLEAGLEHLEQLAGHYRRLSGRGRREDCDLAVLARDAAAAASGTPAGGGKGGRPVRIHYACAESVPAILADPVSVRRILDNLLRNAVESLPPAGGEVAIRVGIGDGEESDLAGDRVMTGDTAAAAPVNRTGPARRVILTVRDTGCGIPSDELDRIFDDFYTTKPEGSGLGLSNVRRLVADCEGTVVVSSTPERGTVFTLSFPAKESPR